MSSYTYGDRQLWDIRSDDAGITVGIRRAPRSALRRTINYWRKRIEAIDKGTARISWGSIQKITAFKRDLLTIDQICFYIEHANGDAIELDEEMIGWPQFVEEVSSRLPGFMKNWWNKVVQPAFAENATVIYDSQQLIKETKSGS